MNNQYSEKDYQEKLELIFNLLTTNKTISDEKIAFFIGGQPGAGKSTLITNAMHFANNNIIVINRDDFRKFYPNIKNIDTLENNYVSLTDDFSARITEDLINILSDKGYNILIEGTLRTYITPASTGRLLKAKGYKLNLEVLAVNKYISYYSTIERYINQCKLFLNERRKTSKEIHDTTCKTLAFNLDKLYKDNIFDNIKILDRDNNVYFNSDVDKNKDIKNIYYEAIKDTATSFSKTFKDIELIKNDLSILNIDEKNEITLALNNLNAQLEIIELKKAYINFLENNYETYLNIEDIDENVISIAHTDCLGDNENYSLQVEYDFIAEKEIITVYSEIFKFIKTNDIDIKQYTEDLIQASFEDFIAQENTELYYSDIDELLQLYQDDESKYLDKLTELNLIAEENDLLEKSIEF